MHIKQYQICKEIYHDVIGNTYIANTEDLTSTVLVKILHESYSKEDDLVQAFHRCAERYCFVENANQIKALEHGQQDEKHYIILNYLLLEPLGHLLKKRHVLSTIEAMAVVEKMATILRTYHIGGMVHGTLNPQNVFIDESLQKVKVADFGFEEFIRVLIEKEKASLSGALPYYSPELIQGRVNLDGRSDIYSLGLLFYEMLVGELPRKVYGLSDETNRESRIPIIPPSLHRLEIPDVLDQIVLKALEPETEKRHQNLSQFIDDLTSAKVTVLADSLSPLSPQEVRNGILQPIPQPGPKPIESEAPEVVQLRSQVQPTRTGTGEVVQPSTDKQEEDQSPSRDEFDLTPLRTEALPFDVPSAQAPEDKSAVPPTIDDDSTRLDVTSPVTTVDDPTARAPIQLPDNGDIGGEEYDRVLEDTFPETNEFATTQTVGPLNTQDRKRSMGSVLRVVLVAVISIVAAFLLIVLTLDKDFLGGLMRPIDNKSADEPQVTVQEAPAGETNGHKVRSEKTGQAEEQERLSQSQPSSIPKPGNVKTSGMASRTQQEEIEAVAGQLDRAPPRIRNDKTRVQRKEDVKLRITVSDGQSSMIADVYLDGVLRGTTNRQGVFLLTGLQVGKSHVIKVQTPGFRMWAKEVSPKQAGIESLEAKMEPLPSAATTPGTMATAPKSEEPLTETNVPRTPLSSPLKKFVSQRDTSLTDKQPESRSQAKYATVNILLSNPQEIGDAFIYVNGERWTGEENRAPTRIELPTGRYDIEVRKEGFRSAPPSYSIHIASGEKRTLRFYITRK